MRVAGSCVTPEAGAPLRSGGSGAWSRSSLEGDSAEVKLTRHSGVEPRVVPALPTSVDEPQNAPRPS